jgi:hypothetical protein
MKEVLPVERAAQAVRGRRFDESKFGRDLFRGTLGYSILCVAVGLLGVWLCQDAFNAAVAGSLGVFLSPDTRAAVSALSWWVSVVGFVVAVVCIGLVKTGHRARKEGVGVRRLESIYFLAVAGPIVGLVTFGAGLLINSSAPTLSWI